MKRRISGFLIACVGLLMVLAPAVSAQQIGSAVPGSITVVGEGTASMPAEQAQVVITIGTDGNAFYDPATGMPIEGAEYTAIDATPMIVATIPDPTTEGLAGLLEAVREAAKAEDLFVNQFSVMYAIADCRPLRQQARTNAVANAALEAEDQAAALNSTVGEVVASRDVTPVSIMGYQPNSCSIGTPMMKPYDTMYMAAPFDPRVPAEVSITLAVEVSYALP